MKIMMMSKHKAVVVVLVLDFLPTGAALLAWRTAAGHDATEPAGEKPLKREAEEQQPILEKTTNEAPKPRTDEDQPAGKKIALLIGVDHYDAKDIPPLESSEAIVELAKVLTSGGYEVTLLCDPKGRQNAAHKPILATIQTQLKAAIDCCHNRQDTILVAFSGHGYQDRDEPFICPADSNPDANTTDTDFSVCQLIDDLGASNAGSKVVFIHACREQSTQHSGISGVRPSPAAGVAVLFACSMGESTGRSDFFFQVREGLRGRAKNEQGQVTFSRLAEYLTEQQLAYAHEKRIMGNEYETPNMMVNVARQPVLMTYPRTEPVLAPKERTAGTVYTNSINMQLVYVPAGEFLMGSPKSEQEKFKAELTGLELENPVQEAQHEVEITKGFYLGKFEVTQEEFSAIMGKNPSRFKGDVRSPVENVSWELAQALCDELSKREGKPYRLPSEAEWEYACRAGTQTTYHCGPTISTDLASYLGDEESAFAKKGVLRLKTMPVGSFEANAWGLHDMHGNVSEWCEDCCDEGFEFYRNSPVRDPLNLQWAYDRVVRGGSWMHPPLGCRSAARSGGDPGGRWYGQSGYQGFRIVLEARQ